MEGECMVLLEVSLMNYILRISKEMKWKAKVILLEASLMNFILWISKEIKWKVKVALSITNELRSSDIQLHQMEGEGGVTRRMID